MAAAHAARDAYYRRLDGPARDQRIAQAQAEMAGPYEVELMVTTWDRRENDLDRGKKSVWRVVLVDEQGNEIEPLEIVKDKRPAFTCAPTFRRSATSRRRTSRDFRARPAARSDVKRMRLRMSSARGGVQLTWLAP